MSTLDSIDSCKYTEITQYRKHKNTHVRTDSNYNGAKSKQVM